MPQVRRCLGCPGGGRTVGVITCVVAEFHHSPLLHRFKPQMSPAPPMRRSTQARPRPRSDTHATCLSPSRGASPGFGKGAVVVEGSGSSAKLP
jgi:hypothetical protein